MQIKKYRAATVREALLKVKQDLGADAVILRTEELRGLRAADEKVEVTAALDPSVPVMAAMPEAQNKPVVTPGVYNRQGGVQKVQWPSADTKEDSGAERRGFSGGKRAKSSETAKPSELQDLKQELNLLRQEMRAQHRTSVGGIPAEFQSLADQLQGAGLPGDMVREIVAETLIDLPAGERSRDTMFASAARTIARRIPVAPGAVRKGRRATVVLFVGPTGMGKSTTLAKIVGRELLEGRAGVAIITTDCYRMGAVEQMQSFAGAADIEMETVFGLEDVDEALDKLRKNELILVDTAGRSRSNAEHLKELQELVRKICPDEVHLVLSLNTRDVDLRKALEAYKPMGVNRLVFTKQDESSEPGALYWLPLQSGLPISWICTGQRIPDDIRVAIGAEISQWILGGNR